MTLTSTWLLVQASTAVECSPESLSRGITMFGHPDTSKINHSELAIHLCVWLGTGKGASK